MNDYNDIIDEILEKEGGYTNDSDDRGGETNFGITKTTARDYGFEGDMKDLQEGMARVIYYSRYISKPGFDRVYNIDKALGDAVILFGVHSGQNRAARFLQRLLNVLNDKEKWYGDLLVDGKVGDKTITSLKQYIEIRGLGGRKIIYEAYKAMVANYYIELAEKDESQEKFMFGWLNRVF